MPRPRPDDDDALVSDLRRWEVSGGVWRVVQRNRTEVTVALLRCDGGEEMGRLSGRGAAWLALLEGREGSED